MSDADRSPLLPSDPFDKLLDRLIGLPGGAHTQPAVVQATDYYGNTTSYMVQTVRTEEGDTAFVTQVNAAGSARFILPPAVIRTIERQRDSNTTQIRRRHGKRLAESAERCPAVPSGAHSYENGRCVLCKRSAPGFTQEARARALATRKRKAAERRRRKQAKAER